MEARPKSVFGRVCSGIPDSDSALSVLRVSSSSSARSSLAQAPPIPCCSDTQRPSSTLSLGLRETRSGIKRIDAASQAHRRPHDKDPQVQKEPQACGLQVARSGDADSGLREVDVYGDEGDLEHSVSGIIVHGAVQGELAEFVHVVCWEGNMDARFADVGVHDDLVSVAVSEGGEVGGRDGRSVDHDSKPHDKDQSVVYGERVEADEAENGVNV
ncbi:hypothetical protein DFH06DRAFT_1138383 [Mycena polygramma]|nr:hypothetical protein DFH06DRAFT_1138383 [Mycena polygramma]